MTCCCVTDIGATTLYSGTDIAMSVKIKLIFNVR